MDGHIDGHERYYYTNRSYFLVFRWTLDLFEINIL